MRCWNCGLAKPIDDSGCITCDLCETCTPAAGTCFDCRDMRQEAQADRMLRLSKEAQTWG